MSAVIRALCSIGGRCLDEIFPWRKLWRPVPTKQKRQVIDPFFAFQACIAVWVVALACFVYLFFTVASLSNIQPKDLAGTLKMADGDVSTSNFWHVTPKIPVTGKHYGLFVVVKRIVEICIIHYMCRNLMHPLDGIEELRLTDLDVAQPQGVVNAVRRLACWLSCRPFRERWLNTFIGDHIMLFTAGFFFFLHNVDVLVRQREIDEEYLEYDPRVQPLEFENVLHPMLAIYAGLLMTGFLFTTLEYNMVPVAERQFRYRVLIACSFTLWIFDFLIILLDRKVYTGYWLNASWYSRVSASLAQIFTTHASVMLGAVMVGHSCHFHKSPDLMWKTFLLKVIPVLALLGGFVHLGWKRRNFHAWQLSDPQAWKWIVQPWAIADLIWSTSCGLLLLGLAYLNHGCGACGRSGAGADSANTDGEHGEAAELAEAPTSHGHGHDHGHDHAHGHGASEDHGAKDGAAAAWSLDYDGALILFTMSLALLRDVNIIFKEKPNGVDILQSDAYYAAIAHLLAPVGLAIFTLEVWRRPPRRGSPARHGLWLAVFFSCTKFFVFQLEEDCHISSGLSPCCSYPKFSKWNAEEHRNLTCNKGIRCFTAPRKLNLQKNEWNYTKLSLYCDMPHGDDHTDSHGPSPSPHMLAAAPTLHSRILQDAEGWGQLCSRVGDAKGGELAEMCTSTARLLAAAAPAPAPAPGPAPPGHDDDDDPAHDFGTCCCCREAHRRNSYYKCGRNWQGDENTCPKLKPGDPYPTQVSDACSKELLCRWKLFEKIGGVHAERQHHSDEESSAYQLFEAIGLAATVEMYFTLVGILIKVILLTEHPNADKIMDLASHHHHVDHETGQDIVVSQQPAHAVSSSFGHRPSTGTSFAGGPSRHSVGRGSATVAGGAPTGAAAGPAHDAGTELATSFAGKATPRC